MKMYIDISPNIDKELHIIMAENNFKTRSEAIIYLTNQFAKEHNIKLSLKSRK